MTENPQGITPAIQKKLYKEWLPQEVRYKPGRGKDGKPIGYISHALVTELLNDVDPNWSSRVTHVHTSMVTTLVNNQPVTALHCLGVTLALTICGVTREESGGPQRMESFTNELKNAQSDALKRAAMRFGVALRMWDALADGADDDDAPPQPLPPRPAQTGERKPAPAREAAAEPPPQQEQPAAPTDDPETRRRKWLNRLQGLCTKHSITPIMLNRLSEETYNVPMGQMTEDQMTEVAAVVTENPLSTWDYIAGLPHVRGMDHMKGSRRPGATNTYPEGSNAAQAQQQHQERFADVPNGAQPMTSRQRHYLWAVATEYAKGNKLDADEFIHGQIAEMFGLTSVTQLTRNQASSLVDRIQAGDIVDYVPTSRADPVQRQEMFGNGAR